MGSTFAAALIGFIGTFFVLWLAIMIFMIVINWKMFEKAGKPGWASIVPIYNIIILFEIIGYKWYYIFLLFLENILTPPKIIIYNNCKCIFALKYCLKNKKKIKKRWIIVFLLYISVFFTLNMPMIAMLLMIS